MFTFTGKHPDWTLGGVAEAFHLASNAGIKQIQVRLSTGEVWNYVTGNWTFWTSGTVAFQIDLDAANG
jgi:hypothetical protein